MSRQTLVIEEGSGSDVPVTHWNDWRWQMQNRISSAAQLIRWLPSLQKRLEAIGLDAIADKSDFRFAVTPYYARLADPADPDCPILKQILPDAVEEVDPLFHQPDPLAEERYMPVPGLTHRYPDRVLWYVTHNCAVYCRFCMRKRKVSDPQSPPDADAFKGALAYIRRETSIKEVILSGGDPLSLSDDRLGAILTTLRGIPHLVSIRIHTRMPVTLPMRITQDFAQLLKDAYPITLVTHFNHAHEISTEAAQAVRTLRMHGTLVLNQSVLLKGVNDSVQSQEELLLGLIRIGVKPYYLHQCDEVRGVSHFRVPVEEGRRILRALRGKNPGIALPTYVIDLPGGGGKVPVSIDYSAGEETDENGVPRALYQNHEGRIFRTIADEEK